MKKIILTGASGLIGGSLCKYLSNSDFEVTFLNRNNCDIFSESSIIEFMKNNPTDCLIHLAWDLSQGYINSDLNYKYKDAGLNLIKHFAENGGKKVISAGSCFEYDSSDKPITENDKINPKSKYAESKVELYEKALDLCKNNNIDFIWGRVFYTFGINEKSYRLVPYMIDSFLNNREVKISFCELTRDYMYSEDVARAFYALTETKYTGAVNISSNEGISMGELALMCAKKMNRIPLLILNSEDTQQAKTIIGDNTLLKKITNFEKQYTISDALDKVIESHKSTW